MDSQNKRIKKIEGMISLQSYGEANDILFISSLSEPLANELDFIKNKKVMVRFWITDCKCQKHEAKEEFIKTLCGIADIDFGANYSEYTGYLWTNEDLKIGGHDLLNELKTHKGKYLFLEIEY